MAKEKQKPTKFRPERVIFLNEQNTGFKTRIEVESAIEQLRDLGWLCSYNEKARPFHMSFNDVEKEFGEFKKDCNDLHIKLKSPVIKADDLDEMEAEGESGLVIPGASAKDSYEDPSGKIHIQS